MRLAAFAKGAGISLLAGWWLAVRHAGPRRVGLRAVMTPTPPPMALVDFLKADG